MEIIISHSADASKTKALLAFLKELDIPFERKKGNDTDYLNSSPAMVARLQKSKEDEHKGKGTTVSLDEIWK